MKTICKNCKREYDYQRGKGHRKTICSACVSKKNRHERKQILVNYKGDKCQICGYNKCLRALCFHHLDPSKKELNLSSSKLFSLTKLKLEADKCILVCHNCHMEIHAKLDL